MKNLEDIVNTTQITEILSYDEVIQKLNEAKEQNVPIEEGIFGAIGGVVLGSAFGPKLGAAICKALGVDPKGSFGSLITSRLVMGAIGATMGWKMWTYLYKVLFLNKILVVVYNNSKIFSTSINKIVAFCVVY